jgi:PAS domain S-box-containing protein
MDTHVAKTAAGGTDLDAPAETKNYLLDDEGFRIAFDDSPVGMVVCAPDGRFVMVNPAFANFLGYESRDLLGRTIASVTADSDVDESVRLFGELLRGDRETFEIEKRYMRADGRAVPAVTTVSTVRGPHREVRYTIAHVIDTSTRHESEITEVGEPDTSGPDLAARLRRRWPRLRVLYVSGYADVDIVPSLGSGASCPSLAKPFDPDQLLRSVRATLGASPRP